MHRLMRASILAGALAAVLGCSSGLESPEARYATAVRARAAFENGDLRRARSLLHDLAAGTRDASAWANLGIAQRRANDVDGAMRSWTRAVLLDRSCAPAQYWLGATRCDRARALRAQAQTDAKHHDELEERAVATLHDAARDLEAAAGAAPAQPAIHLALAEVYAELGKPAAAQKARDEAARLDPVRRSTLANSGLESLHLPPRPRPSTAGQIPMHFEAAPLDVRALRITASAAEGAADAGLFVAPRAGVLRCDSLPDGKRWTESRRLSSDDVALSLCADMDGDGRSDLVYFTTEHVSAADPAAGEAPNAPPKPGGGAGRAKSGAAARSAAPTPTPAQPMRGWWAPAGDAPRFIGEVPAGISLLHAADLDHDGDQDLILSANDQPAVRVWRNDGSQFTVERATPAGLETLPFLRDLVAADFDGDGLVDLVTADRGGRLRVLVQRADGSFAAVTDMAGLYLERARTLAAADMDGDGNTDLLIGNDAGLWLYANRGMARFVREAAYRPPQTSWGADRAPAVAVVGLVVTDLDNDGTCDVLTLHPVNPLPAGVWLAAVRAESAKPAAAGGAAKPPAEDTAPEPPLLASPVTGMLRLWRNDGRGVLLDATEVLGIASDTLRCDPPVVADLDRDGDRDLAWVRADSTVIVHWNEGGNANRRVLFTLEGDRGARDGVGARLEVHAGDLVHSIEVDEQPLWFGLQRQGTLDVVRVCWPDGTIQNWLDLRVPPDGRLRMQRGITRP
jgi:hypothetical protein